MKPISSANSISVGERIFISLSFSLSFSFWFLSLFHASFIFLDPGNSSKEGEIDAVSEGFIESRIIPILLEFSFQIHSISQNQHIVFKYLDKLKMDNNRLKCIIYYMHIAYSYAEVEDMFFELSLYESLGFPRIIK